MRPGLVAVVAGLWALCTGGSALAAGAGAEAAVRALNADEVAAFLRADTKALARIWADGFVVTNPLNKFVGKSQVLDMVGSGMLRFTSLDRTIDYLRLYGDTAIVAGAETAVWAGKMPLAGKTSRLRFTAVWIRSAGAWREVARHANIVPGR